MIFCKPQNNDLEPNSYIHKPNFDERVCYHMIVPSNLTYPFCVQIPLKLKTPKKQTESTLSNEPYFPHQRCMPFFLQILVQKLPPKYENQNDIISKTSQQKQPVFADGNAQIMTWPREIVQLGGASWQ